MAPNRVWIITGSSSGLGKAMAEYALSRGDMVVATARKVATLDDLKRRHSPGQLLVMPLDVTVAEGIAKVFAEAKAAFGQVDIVFNNAGVGIYGEVEAASDDQARQLFETNFWGGANVTKEAVRFFRDDNPAGLGGRLLNVSSWTAMYTLGGLGHYAASKAALDALSRSLQDELNPKWNIKISIVVLGVVRTSFAPNSTILPIPPAYNDPSQPVAAARKYAEAIQDPNSGISQGDACKTAGRLFDLTRVDDPPLRFVIGTDSIEKVNMELQSIRQEVEAYASWSVGVRED